MSLFTHKTLMDNIVESILIRSIDKPFLVCLCKCSLIFLTTIGFFLFPEYSLLLLPLHFLIYFYFLSPFITMFHDLNHQSLFKNKIANDVIVGIFGLIYGMTPFTYFCHHIMMHHAEDNGLKDLSSTMPYRRDSFKDFCKYYSRFIFCFPNLSQYLKQSKNKRRRMLANRMFLSESVYIGISLLLAFFYTIPVLAILILPTITTRSFLIMGNWAEHAFIDPKNPNNIYTNTANILGVYNNRWFNVGYHIGHHLQPASHFSSLADEFNRNIDRYAQEDAVVFTDVHFPHIWFYLMTKNYKKLARIYVQLPGRAPRSEAEIIDLLKNRLQPILTA